MREKGTILQNGGLATPNGASFSRISQPPTRSRCEAMLHDAFAGLSGMRMVEELAQLARAKLSMAELLELRYKIDVMLQGREALVLRDSYTASSASIACALSTNGRSRGSTGQGCSGSRAMTSRTDSRAGLGFADQTPPRALLDPLGRAAPAPRFTAHAGTERLQLRVASRQHILLPPQTARPAPQLLTAAMPSEPGGAAIVTHRRISDEAREMLAEIGARGQSDFREPRKRGGEWRARWDANLSCHHMECAMCSKRLLAPSNHSLKNAQCHEALAVRTLMDPVSSHDPSLVRAHSQSSSPPSYLRPGPV